MFKFIAVALATTSAALALGACGSDDASGVSPETARAGVERAAQLRLTPIKAEQEGLRASYSNASTAGKDKQVVALFVMDDADVADKVVDEVRASAPPTAKLIVHDSVMVVYAAAGADRAAAVERAVEAL